MIPAGKNFVTGNLTHAVLSNQYIQPQFTVTYNNGYEVRCSVKLLDTVVPLEENAIASPLMFQHDTTFYLWQKTEDVLLAERFLSSGKIFIADADWNKQLADFILPLTKNYDVQFSGIQKEEIKNDLQRMISFVEKLDELDLEGTEPLLHMSDNVNVLRDDEVKGSITREEALKNAPQHDEVFFKVPKVIKKPE